LPSKSPAKREALGGFLTLPAALEIIRQTGSIQIENGKLLARFPETERGRLQPALDLLRSQREEVLRLLEEPPAEPAAPAQAERRAEMEPTTPLTEPAAPEPSEPTPPLAAVSPEEPGVPSEPAKTLADVDPEERGVPYAQWRAIELNELFREHGTLKEPGHITGATIRHGLKETNKEPTRTTEPSPPSHRVRELLRVEGWREAHNEDLPLEDRCEGLLKVIEACYWRSLQAWNITSRVRWPVVPLPDFREFCCSWLWSNSFRTDPPFEDLQPVCEALRQHYPPPAKPGIGEGLSYWGTGENHQHRNRFNSPPIPEEKGEST
jgi:hypothetical protein